MVIREKIRIEAPLSVVWSVFTCLEDWAQWNGVCESACLMAPSSPDEKRVEEVSEGACIAFTIRPAIFPIRITPRVTRYVPHREIVWEGRRFGVHAEHAFAFDERDKSVLVTSTEKFGGFGLLLSRLALVPSRLHHLTRELLLALKREAESRVFPGKP
ncbi:MAG: SRPBCC family protein [Syntrophobacteraceae bacterium]